MTEVFQTERLIVRLLSRDDFAKLHEICGDAEVMKYVGDLKPYTEPQTRQVILKCLRSYEWHNFGGWGLLDRATGQFVGYGGFEMVPERNFPELFYILSPSHWGQGYATEFARAAIHHAFNTLGLKKIGASFDPRNEASMSVARKVGFHFSREGLDEFNLPTIYYELISNHPPEAQ